MHTHTHQQANEPASKQASKETKTDKEANSQKKQQNIHLTMKLNEALLAGLHAQQGRKLLEKLSSHLPNAS